jgi:hypothetical protein
LVALPSSYPLKPAEGPKSIAATLKFVPGTADAFLINLQATLGLGVTQFCSVYIDNTNCPGRTTVSLTGSNETIIAEPFTRGVYPCAGQTLTLMISCDSSISATVPIIIYNYVIPPFVDSSIATALGSRDVVTAVRSGNDSGSFNVLSSNTGWFSTGFSASNYAYYYITHLSLKFQGTPPTAGNTLVILADNNSDNTVTYKTFFGPEVFYPGVFADITIFEFDNLNLYGIGDLSFIIETPFSGGLFTFNVVGGVSNTIP